MTFDELDQESASLRPHTTGGVVLPVLPSGGRNIQTAPCTRLTKEVHKFEAPFDERMPRSDGQHSQTPDVLPQCGFRVVYGFTQSDEISLLFHPDEDSFERKLRKYDSILAAEASACFSLQLGAHGVLRLAHFTASRLEQVVDYFLWRSEDAHRNALNSHCYWLLRKQGQGVNQATSALEGLSVAAKNELLFQHGINFNDLPRWQKHQGWASSGKNIRRGL